jgi:hypothetical protein
MPMNIIIQKATEKIDRWDMLDLAKTEDGQKVLIERIEHLQDEIEQKEEGSGKVILYCVRRIKDLEQDLKDLEQELQVYKEEV